MNKKYEKPIIEIVELESEDVLTTSGVRSFDPLGLLEHDADDWDWD